MRIAYRVVLALGVFIFTTTTTVAASGSSWEPATSIAHRSAHMDVAVNPAGNAIAVWWASDFTGIEAATRRAGQQSWSLERIAPGPDLPEGADPHVMVEVDAKGNATVAWVEEEGGWASFRILAATRPAGGRFSAPELVASGVETFVGQTILEVGAGGQAIVLWANRRRHELATFADVAVARPGGSFGEPQRIGSGLSFSDLADVAVDKQGRMLVVWRDLYERINAAAAASGARFAPGRVISAEGYKSSPQVVFGADGSALAVWGRSAPGFEVRVLESSLRTGGGRWLQPEPVASAPWIFQPRITLDARGTAHAIWIAGDRSGSDRRIGTAFRPASGSWQKPRTLVPPSAAILQGLDLAANASGNAIAVWHSEQGVAGAYLRTGRWSSPVSMWPEAPTAAARVTDASPAIDGSGNAFVVWPSCCTAEPVPRALLWAAGYDATGPQLRKLRIPAAGRVGKPHRFSASPLDVWSGATVARWSFGDGTRATGNRVTHSYRLPGTYTVRVTSSDSRGHTTAATRRIRIRRAASE